MSDLPSTGESISGTQLADWRRVAQRDAGRHGISPDEVDWLLRELTGLERLALQLELFRTKPSIPLPCSFAHLDTLWRRRLDERMPVQYLVEQAPWRQFSLRVSPAVLIPRPETELLIDLSIEASTSAQRAGHWADLGTGSGAIAIGLATAFPQAMLHAVDQSADALAVAQDNARRCGVGDRIQFHHGSWFEPLKALKGELSAVVSNPPYIPTSQLATLQPEVAQHEPWAALDGGDDGLDCIRHLVDQAPHYLKSGGLWLIEMMAGQAEAVTDLLQRQGSYCDISIHADLAGIARFALAHRR